LQGTFHKYRNPEKEAEFSEVKKIPPPPGTLNRYGKSLWRRIGPELLASKILTAADLPVLEILCMRYGMGMELYDLMTLTEEPDEKTGRVKRGRKSIAGYLEGRNSQTTAEYNAMKSEFQAVRALMTEFGLTPASRNRFGVPGAKGETEIEAETRRILNG
jgi:P27 family predicted phage terminase small subunit